MTIYDIIAGIAANLRSTASEIRCPDSEGGKVASKIKEEVLSQAAALESTMSGVAFGMSVAGTLNLTASDLDNVSARIGSGILIPAAAAVEVTQIANRLRAELAPEPPPSGTGGNQG